VKKLVLQLLYSVSIRQFLKIILGVHYENREVLRQCPQFILAGNHNSHLDTVALMAALPANCILHTQPVAAGDYFGKTGIKRRLSEFFINALLIPRRRPQPGDTFADPIDMMLQALDKGHSLILFPEGTRGEPGKMQKFKKGIGLVLSQRPDIPFIPVYLKGMGKMLPKGEAVLVPFNSFVRFGAPVYCQGLSADEIVARVEQEILALALDQHLG
jgi:1-acyl-sn-glycerol-3-phosphate acyltransferase